MLPVVTNQLVNMSKTAWKKHRYVQPSFLLAGIGGVLVFIAGIIASGYRPHPHFSQNGLTAPLMGRWIEGSPTVLLPERVRAPGLTRARHIGTGCGRPYGTDTAAWLGGVSRPSVVS